MAGRVGGAARWRGAALLQWTPSLVDPTPAGPASPQALSWPLSWAWAWAWACLAPWLPRWPCSCTTGPGGRRPTPPSPPVSALGGPQSALPAGGWDPAHLPPPTPHPFLLRRGKQLPDPHPRGACRCQLQPGQDLSNAHWRRSRRPSAGRGPQTQAAPPVTPGPWRPVPPPCAVLGAPGLAPWALLCMLCVLPTQGGPNKRRWQMWASDWAPVV